MTNDSRKYMEIREGFYYLAIPNVETTARWFAKSYIVWGAILLMLGFGIGKFVNIPAPTIPVATQQTSTLEQQAAAGGAAIPFPSVSPSPPPLTTPPSDSWEPSPTEEAEEELNGCTSTNTSEESSPSSPQADAGQTTSTRFYRTPRRLIR